MSENVDIFSLQTPACGYIIKVPQKIKKMREKTKERNLKMKNVKTLETAKGKLTYSLFCEDMDGVPHYGVSVVSSVFSDGETASVRDITTELPFAERLLALLADNAVLPSTLSEVIEECVAAEFTV